MADNSYQQRRGEVQTYFDRTAVEAWRKLTSTDKVSRIRETVRRGREDMRQTLLDWLPADLTGRRLLDAGCGTGALAVEAARRGAEVLAIDVAPTLIEIARERVPATLGAGSVRFEAGDMLDPAHGKFDHVVAMDSLIHYQSDDMIEVVAALAERTTSSILFTFAPRTIPLALMHALGQFFPRGDRSPAIVPVGVATLQARLGAEARLQDWRVGRARRVSVGFYTSQAMELVYD